MSEFVSESDHKQQTINRLFLFSLPFLILFPLFIYLLFFISEDLGLTIAQRAELVKVANDLLLASDQGPPCALLSKICSLDHKLDNIRL